MSRKRIRTDRERSLLGSLALVGLVLLMTGCRSGSPPPPSLSLDQAFFTDKLAEIDLAIEEAIEQEKCPGGVLWIERDGAVYAKPFGKRALVPEAEPMTLDTVFDLASLTKVLACTPAVMLLVEEGKIDLDAPVARYLPRFAAHGKETITIRQLLTHTSGLRPDISLKPDWAGVVEAVRLSCEEKLRAQPGERFIYSDTGPIVLAAIVQHLSGEAFDQFVAQQIYAPLGMTDTGYNPPSARRARIAPTTIENGEPVRGVVHDPRARRMNGVAGHAGLFATAADVARFARMMLKDGKTDAGRLFQAETVRLMTSVQTPPHVPQRRGLGWDIDSGYASQRGNIFPVGGYGHTGWTGTSLWIDPFSRTFVIFLSNRNHPDESGSVIALRRRIGTLAAEAVRDFNFHNVPGALPRRADAASSSSAKDIETVEVLNGIDVLIKQGFVPLRGRRLGLITNHTGQDRFRNPTIDLLHEAEEVDLKALFSPEHGIRGALDAHVADGADDQTGLPIFSLYDETRSPKPEELEGIDALVFDIQDIGCRFYTYISTMGLCMEAAAEAEIEFFVLDRVNPITGRGVEGPIYEGEPQFTAFHSIPVRHAMTVGELAKLFNQERGWNTKLTVIPMENWQRDLWFDQTSLPWINPSPNMRNLTQATLYPGIGLLETMPLSVGRGTDTPFEIIGAPYINDVALSAELNRSAIEGLRFTPVRFTPDASVFKGKECGGVRMEITDRNHADVFAAGLTIASTLHRLYPDEFKLERLNRLLQHKPTLAALREGKSPSEIRGLWRSGLAEFKQRRDAVLIYD